MTDNKQRIREIIDAEIKATADSGDYIGYEQLRDLKEKLEKEGLI